MADAKTKKHLRGTLLEPDTLLGHLALAMLKACEFARTTAGKEDEAAKDGSMKGQHHGSKECQMIFAKLGESK